MISVEDITPFVADQRQNLAGGFDELITPEEHVYCPDDLEVALSVGIHSVSN